MLERIADPKMKYGSIECDQFSRPLRDWTHSVNPTPHFVRGYFHAVPSGLLRALGEVSDLTADGPRLYQRQRLKGKQLETVSAGLVVGCAG
jgi:hypothetical protein